MDSKELSFEILDKKYEAMMHKFNLKYKIPGYDTDDIIQELRITLMKAQQLYDERNKSSTSFSTYIYVAFNNTMMKIFRDTQGRKKNIPSKRISSIENMDGYILGISEYASNDIEVEQIDFLTGLGKEATLLGEQILMGNTNRNSWLAAGLSRREIRKGKIEIGKALTGKTNVF